MNAPSTFRVVLVQLAGYLNLLIGLLFLAIGAWIIVSGVQAINLLFEAQDQISNAVPQGVVPQNAEAAKVADTGTKGLAGIIAGLAGIAGAVMIAFGLPHLLVALGIFMRTGWGRILGILMGLWLLLSGAGLLFGSNGATIPLLNGGLYLLTGLISVIGLIGGSATVAYNAGKKRNTQAGDKDLSTASAPKSAAAISAAAFASLIIGIGIVAFMKLGDTNQTKLASNKDKTRALTPDDLELIGRKLAGENNPKLSGKKDPVVTQEPTSEEVYRQRLTSVMDAIDKGQLSRVREFLENTKLDVNDRDETGATMLHRAIGSNQFEIARYLLLEKKADITATDKTGHDVFLLACAKGYGHTLFNVLSVGTGSVYLKRGNDYVYPKGVATSGNYLTFNYTPRLKNNLGQTGWMLAAKNGHLETLVEFKKSPSVWNGSTETSLRDNSGKSATDLAKEAGHTAVVEYLESGKHSTVIVPKVDPKIQPEPMPKAKDLLLVKAVQEGDTIKVVDLLNQANSESLLSEADDKGMTALMIVASKGNVDMVAAICNKIRATKPEPLALKDKTEKTALIHAAMGGHTDCCELIMVALSEAWKNHQVNWFDIYDTKDSTKKTAYEHAEANKHPATAKILKETFLALCDSVTRDFPKADAGTEDSFKTSTILEKVCREGDLQTVKRMLALGAKAPTKFRSYSGEDPRNRQMRTPLMWACTKGHLAIVKVLLESYGDDQAARLNQLNIRCKFEWNALLYACQSGQYACAKALLESIGDNGKELNAYASGTTMSTTPITVAKGNGHQELVTLLEKYIEKAKELIEKKSKEEKK